MSAGGRRAGPESGMSAGFYREGGGSIAGIQSPPPGAGFDSVPAGREVCSAGEALLHGGLLCGGGLLHEDGQHEEDIEALDEKQKGVHRPAVFQHDGGDAEADGEEENKKDGLVPGKPQLVQLVVDVILSDVIEPLADGRHLPRAEPEEGDVGHIKEHHPEDEQGHQKSFYGIYPVPLSQYSQAGEGKPDEDAPRVPEEDGGRLVGAQVVGEKAEAPPP